MHLSVAVVPAPDQVVVRLTGDAGRPTLTRLVPALTTAAGHGTASVVVDVAGARFRDGSALEALAGFSDALAAAGRHCRVVGAPAATRRLVSEAGLSEHLELDGLLTGQDPVPPRPPARPRHALDDADLEDLPWGTPARSGASRAARPGTRVPLHRRH